MTDFNSTSELSTSVNQEKINKLPPPTEHKNYGLIFIIFIWILIISVGKAINTYSSTLKDGISSIEINSIINISPFPTSVPLPTRGPSPTPIPNTCNIQRAAYLPKTIDITPAVYVTRTVEREIVQNNGFYTEIITTNDHIITDPKGVPPTKSQVTEFRSWALTRGIALIGTNRSYEDLKEGQFDLKKDQIPIEQIGQVMNAYEALKLLPASIIERMNGTAIYMSTVDGTLNYALYADESPEEIAEIYKTNPNIVRHGIFLLQPITKRVTIHEVGHLIGTIGIQGLYGDEYSSYKNLRTEYNNIFNLTGLGNLPCGYVSDYSTTNDAENFAEHFSYYVINGKGFRDRTTTDTLLKAKYDFLKIHIFEGKEY